MNFVNVLMGFFFPQSRNINLNFFHAERFDLNLINLKVEHEESEDNKLYIFENNNNIYFGGNCVIDTQRETKEEKGPKMIMFYSSDEKIKTSKSIGNKVRKFYKESSDVHPNPQVVVCTHLAHYRCKNNDMTESYVKPSKNQESFKIVFNRLKKAALTFKSYKECLEAIDTICKILKNQNKSDEYKEEYDFTKQKYSLRFFGEDFDHCLAFFRDLRSEVEKQASAMWEDWNTSSEDSDKGNNVDGDKGNDLSDRKKIKLTGEILNTYVEKATKSKMIVNGKEYAERLGFSEYHLFYLCLFADMTNLFSLVLQENSGWIIYDFCSKDSSTKITGVDSLVIQLSIEENESTKDVFFLDKQKPMISQAQNSVNAVESFVSSDKKQLYIVLDKKHVNLLFARTVSVSVKTTRGYFEKVIQIK